MNQHKAVFSRCRILTIRVPSPSHRSPCFQTQKNNLTKQSEFLSKQFGITSCRANVCQKQFGITSPPRLMLRGLLRGHSDACRVQFQSHELTLFIVNSTYLHTLSRGGVYTHQTVSISHNELNYTGIFFKCMSKRSINSILYKPTLIVVFLGGKSGINLAVSSPVTEK